MTKEKHTVIVRDDLLAAMITSAVIQATHAVKIEDRRWLTFDDLMRITGFDQNKLRDLVRREVIPMFRAPNREGEYNQRGEWRITPAAWEETEKHLVNLGLLPENRLPE